MCSMNTIISIWVMDLVQINIVFSFNTFPDLFNVFHLWVFSFSHLTIKLSEVNDYYHLSQSNEHSLKIFPALSFLKTVLVKASSLGFPMRGHLSTCFIVSEKWVDLCKNRSNQKLHFCSYTIDELTHDVSARQCYCLLGLAVFRDVLLKIPLLHLIAQ